MELPDYDPIVEPTYNPYRVLWLRNGVRVCRCVWELVYRCQKHGIRFEIVDGYVIPHSDDPGMVTEGLIEDLKFFGPGVVALLLNTPGDSTDRRF